MIARLRRRAGSEEGLTLVELMIVVMLLGVVVAPAIAFLASSQRSQNVVGEAVQQQQDARTALETFSRSLREGTYPQGLDFTNSSIFYYAADDDVIFYTDVHNDESIDKVEYSLDTAHSQIVRTVTTPDCSSGECSYGSTATVSSAPVISNVRNADTSVCAGGGGATKLFTYFKQDRSSGAAPQAISPGGVINDLVDISYVQMRLVVDVTPGKAPTCQIIDTAVTLRNWRGS